MDRFISPCPPPTPHQREVAEILIEECAEVQQRCTKLLRFGVEEIQSGQHLDNRERLSLEVGDLLETIGLAQRAGILHPDVMEHGRERKRMQLARFMQTDPEPSPPQAEPTPGRGRVINETNCQRLISSARELLRYFERHVDAGPLLSGNPTTESRLIERLREAVDAVDPPDHAAEASRLGEIRRTAWETRRAKYGERGNRGSYLRDRP